MADETTTTFVNLLWEAKGPLAKQLDRACPLMSEIQKDSSPEVFDGEKFRMGVVLTQVQGTTVINETGTLNSPQTLDNTKTRIDVGIVTVPISFSTKVMNQSNNSKAAWLDVVDGKMQLAEQAFRDVINEAWNQDGTALLAQITQAATSATQTVSGPDSTTQPPNFYWLYEGRIVDVLNRADGATVSLGRKIISYDDVNNTVTFDASVTIPDGTKGIYLQGTFQNSAYNTLVGFGQIGGTSGTFQEVSRTTYPQWKGTDASPSSITDLTMQRFDAAERKSRRRSGNAPDLWWGDPAVIDRFAQNITPNARWAGNDGTLKTGWTGVAYRNHVLLPEFASPAGYMRGTQKKDIKILTLDNGPDWDQKDGAMFRRFSRALPLEAWLVWMLNLGAVRCNSTVTISKCAQAVA